MYSAAVRRLTAWYVLILVLVSLFFSITIYQVAVGRLVRGAREQGRILEEQGIRMGPVPTVVKIIEEARALQIKKDKQELLEALLLMNIFVIAVGAYGSYVFARRTMHPIAEVHAGLSKFTTDASHELRTPLAVMQAEIEVALADKNATKKDYGQTLGSNLEEIAHLQRLSEQLLTLARIDLPQSAIESVRLHDVVKKQINYHQKQSPAPISAKLDETIQIKGSAELLGTATGILLDNAIKYAAAKDPAISVGVFKRSGKAVIEVADNGIGIRPEDLPHVFNRFYRGSHGKQKISGHGLGLSIAKQIVEKHGGSIRARANSGGGTIFSILLPL